jgi:hypothetical protein
MQLKEVIDNKTKTDFLNLPKTMYKNDPEWIMPLDNDINDVFDPNRNEAFKNDGRAIRWVLYDEGKPVGRIAAFHALMPNGEKEAGAGFFECVDYQDAANILFDAACNWLRSEGCTKVDAPVNFGDRDSFWGLMVSGFKNHSYRENYNFPYYQALFENYGFEKTIEQSTSQIFTKDFNYERFSRISQRVTGNSKYEFKSLDWSQIDKFADDFVEIYNKAWEAHEFFVPMTKDKIMSRMKLMKPIAPGKINIFAYADGKPAAFYINVLDVNQIFKYVNGKLNWWGMMKFLWYRRKVNRVRAIVFGVIPEYHNTGIETGMIMKFYDFIKDHPVIKSSELAWIGDFNPKMHSMFNSLGANTVKVHYTMSKEL